MRSRCALAGVIVAVGCGTDSGPRPSAPATQVVQVGTVEVRPRRIEIATELPGRTSAYRVAQVHARVDGIVLKRLYVEGADVREGQPLFQIDPAPLQAAVARARAQVTSTQAEANAARLVAERDEVLIRTGAIAREEYDNAVARAAAADATLLTTVTQLDPIYVDVALPVVDLLRVRRAMESGQLEASAGKAPVRVVFEDGRVYGEAGSLLVTGVNVDETTGSVAVRALVPNPRGELLPGMYVRARVQEGVDPNALLVPQRAVTRDRTGQATALVVKQGRVEPRVLQIDRAVEDAWLVTAGVVAGEHVIVEGQQKVKPGMTVDETPAPASLPKQVEEPPYVGVW